MPYNLAHRWRTRNSKWKLADQYFKVILDYLSSLKPAQAT